MTKTKLQEFQSSSCYKCGFCQERKLQDESKLDIRNSGLIKIWCYGIDDIHPIEFGNCYIRETAE